MLSILTIEPYTRKVAVIHDCQNSLCLPGPANTILHDSTSALFENKTFFVLSKKEGFPPRQG